MKHSNSLTPLTWDEVPTLAGPRMLRAVCWLIRVREFRPITGMLQWFNRRYGAAVICGRTAFIRVR